MRNLRAMENEDASTVKCWKGHDERHERELAVDNTWSFYSCSKAGKSCDEGQVINWDGKRQQFMEWVKCASLYWWIQPRCGKEDGEEQCSNIS